VSRQLRVVVLLDLSRYVLDDGTFDVAAENAAWATLTAAGPDRSVRLVLGDLRFLSSRCTQVLKDGLSEACHVVIEGVHPAVTDALAVALNRFDSAS
jgi:hypothetical protein